MSFKRKLILLCVLVLTLTLCCFGLVACCDGGNDGGDGEESGSGTSHTIFIISDDGSTITGLTEYGKTLTELVIPETLDGKTITSIGKKAFYDCISLTSVTIGNSVTRIRERAFYGCYSLTSVTIGSGVISIEEDAFEYCSSLTSIVIPDSVTSIGDGAFDDCNSLQYNEYENAYYLGNESNPYLWLIEVKSTDITTCVINDNCKYICNCEFLPQGVFFACNSLQYNEYENAYYLGNESNPYLCLIKAKSIDITTCTINDNCRIIYRDAFYGCNSLTSVVIPDSVTSIGYCAFQNCSSLTSIVIPDSVTSISGQAFYGCDSLTSITIGSGVTSIGGYAFNKCNNLNKVNYTGTVDQWAQICFVIDYNEWSSDHSWGMDYSNPISCAGKLYINNVLLTEANITTATINSYAFYNCRSLTSVTIGSGVTNIGIGAFYNCTSLTSITIGSGVTSIGSSAFRGCSNLKKVNYTGTVDQWAQISFVDIDSNPIHYTKDLYINNVLLTEANITTATRINDYAFYNCKSLTSVTIGSGVTSVGNYAFAGCSKLTSVTIGNSVTSIGSSAFSGCTSLTSVTIGNSVTSIGSSAFSGCTSLTSVTIGNSVTRIGSSAFNYCSSLTSITIPDNVTSIGYQAFFCCSSLTSITLGNNVTSIGNYAFRFCYKLVEVINKSSLNIEKGSSSNGHVGYYALKVKTEGESEIVNQNGYLFYTANSKNYLIGYVGKATSLTLPENYNGQNYEIYQYAFFYCTSLTSVKIGSSVTSIGSSAFYNCRSLTSIVIPDSVTSIGDDAFYNCTSLTSVTFENTSGWYVLSSSTATSGTDVTVTDAAQNATYLTDTYDGYYWKRK